MIPCFSNLYTSSMTGSNAAKGTFLLGLNHEVSHFPSVRISLWFLHTFRDLPKIHKEKLFFRYSNNFLSLYFYFLKKCLLFYNRNLLAVATNQIIWSNRYQINLMYFVTHTLLIFNFFFFFLRKEIWHIKFSFKLLTYFLILLSNHCFFRRSGFLYVSTSKH